MQNPNFFKLFMSMRELLVTILLAKGGAVYLCREQSAVKQIIRGLDQLAVTLSKEHEITFGDLAHELFQEESIPGIFDGTELVERILFKLIKRNSRSINAALQDSVRLRIYAQQLSTTLKYILTGTKMIDFLYKKQTDGNYDVEFLNALNQVSNISNKNRLSNQALRCISYNEFFLPLFIGILTCENFEDAQLKHAEIAMACDILYQGNNFSNCNAFTLK